MNYRTTKLLALKTYVADFTELIEINTSDPISEIMIRYSALNGPGGAGSTAHWAKGITKVELVDGSDVMASLTGMELYALAFIHSKKVSGSWLHYLNTNYFEIIFRLPFGRYLWDPNLAFDPKMFKNPQLRITSDLNAGGCAPTASKLTVYALCFDQKEVSPIGFIQNKEVKSYTMGSASHEYTDLPTDLPIRRLMVKALLAGTEPGGVIDNVKLTEDNDKKIILDLSFNELLHVFADDNPLYHEGFMIQWAASQQTYHCTPSQYCTQQTVQWADAADAYCAVAGFIGGILKVDATGAGNGEVLINGYCPNGVISIPLGNPDEIDDWFDPTALRNLRLDLLSASAGSTYTAEIIAQQLRRY